MRDTLARAQVDVPGHRGDAGPWVGGVFVAEIDPSTIVLVLEERGRTLAATLESQVES